IVICRRGVNPRVEKGRNVELGGAGGMVLVNTAAEGEGIVGDAHELPAVHLGYNDAKVLEAWVLDGGTGHTATIAGTTVSVAPENGDIMAGFSSRGPNKPAPGVLKPDITGPGVDILAAVNTPAEYGILSGTSMSSPHLAGSAALLRALHRDWTPAEVQSAIMTTARDSGVRKEDGVRSADSFDMGAGRVDLTTAGRAGFVMNEETAKYTGADPAAGGDPTTLNIPSLTHANCVGTCTWTRTIKGTVAGSWKVTTSGPRNLKLTVSPASFTLAPGQTQTLTISADVSKLPAGKYAFGRVTLASSAAPEAHFPVVVLPGGTAQPVDIETTSTTGTKTVTVTSPIEIKSLSTRVSGLTRGVVENRTLEQDPTPLDPYDTSVGTFTVLVDVPAGARFIASEIAETTATDLDLFIGRDDDGDGQAELAEELCRSASETAFESCRLSEPEGGKYWIRVQNWLTGGLLLDDVELVAAVVPGTDAGNLTVSGPKTVAANTPFDVTLAYNVPTLGVGETWFGLVELGSDRKNIGNAGSLFVRLERTG
ncbi:MAG TPA: S8 family serine peptidase, partial [Gaiellaceae bacterium]|nr:S8 family serine peptidase [Gaiellaceae bacterium]